MNPYGTSSYSGSPAFGNNKTLRNESFFIVATNEHNSSTGVSVCKLQGFNAIGTRIINYSYTFTPTTAMPTLSNFLDIQKK